MPVLSCSMRTFFMGPMQFVLTRNVSLLPRLNMVLLLFFRWILRVVPVLPNKVMKTLALVPPPITSPVTVTISYSEKQNCETVTYPQRNINITETKQKQKKKRNQEALPFQRWRKVAASCGKINTSTSGQISVLSKLCLRTEIKLKFKKVS